MGAGERKEEQGPGGRGSHARQQNNKDGLATGARSARPAPTPGRQRRRLARGASGAAPPKARACGRRRSGRGGRRRRTAFFFFFHFFPLSLFFVLPSSPPSLPAAVGARMRAHLKEVDGGLELAGGLLLVAAEGAVGAQHKPARPPCRDVLAALQQLALNHNRRGVHRNAGEAAAAGRQQAAVGGAGSGSKAGGSGGDARERTTKMGGRGPGGCARLP